MSPILHKILLTLTLTVSLGSADVALAGDVKDGETKSQAMCVLPRR